MRPGVFDQLLAIVVCILPVGLVTGLVVWLVSSSRGRSHAALEAELQQTRSHVTALLHRVQHLESGLTWVCSQELPSLHAKLAGLADPAVAAAAQAATDSDPSGASQVAPRAANRVRPQALTFALM